MATNTEEAPDDLRQRFIAARTTLIDLEAALPENGSMRPIVAAMRVELGRLMAKLSMF
jgi:hypothetical protein